MWHYSQQAKNGKGNRRRRVNEFEEENWIEWRVWAASRKPLLTFVQANAIEMNLVCLYAEGVLTQRKIVRSDCKLSTSHSRPELCLVFLFPGLQSADWLSRKSIVLTLWWIAKHHKNWKQVPSSAVCCLYAYTMHLQCNYGWQLCVCVAEMIIGLTCEECVRHWKSGLLFSHCCFAAGLGTMDGT